MINQSVTLQGLPVRPVPRELLDKVVCTHCKENPARWEVGPALEGSWNYACSFCFLYALPVVCEQRPQLNWLIREAEKARGVIFQRNKDGALIKELDADCIAFAIVAGNKIFDAHQRLKAHE